MCLKWITLVTFYMSAVLLLHTRVSYPRSDAHRGCRVTAAFNPAVMCHFRWRADCKNTELIWTRTASHEMKTLFSITASRPLVEIYNITERRGEVTWPHSINTIPLRAFLIISCIISVTSKRSTPALLFGPEAETCIISLYSASRPLICQRVGCSYWCCQHK